MSFGPAAPSRVWRFISLAAAFAFSALSCGREITGPDARIRWARGLSIDAVFPTAASDPNVMSSGLVDFNRVRVVFRRSDQSIALDQIVNFPATSDSIEVRFDVPVSGEAASTGEAMTVSMAYVNAAGDTVFRGGPTPVVVRIPRSGETPAPFRMDVQYVGPGADATAVTINQDTITVTAGQPFTFTASAWRNQDAVTAPISWRSLDMPRATLTAMAAGSGNAGESRGAARIVSQLLTGPADTATLIVLPRLGSLVAVSGAAQTGAVSVPLPQQIAVRSLATDGLPIGFTSLTLSVTAGGGSISDTALVTDASGNASFTWTLGPTVGTQSVRVSAAGVSALVVNATATSTGPASLAITQEPAAVQVAGANVTPAVQVQVRDAGGAVLSGFTGAVTLELAENPAGGSLLGTLSVNAVAGIASFNAWRVERAGAGYRVRARVEQLVSPASAAFTVNAAAADSLALVSGGGQVGSAGGALAQPVVLRVMDAFGNPVAGSIVTFAVATGSLSASADTTDAAGLASVNWTLGGALGAQTLTVTAAGLRGSPLAVPATAGGGIVTTTVSPLVDTLTAIGATRTLTAQSRDTANAVVAGSYTWVSRTPAVATVSAAGVVTALTNGDAWIVVTEAGGTRDSSRITVQQRLATIAVTPNPRDVYLGASYQFSATAVDGLGVALAQQPSFTWSTGASAIASVSAGGLATGVGLGSTTVRATAGAVTGVATLNVRTPITRIVVRRDSTGFSLPDTFSLSALAQTRSYRAVAYDTLDAVMTGISFNWASSNPAVATLDSTGTVTARAVAMANGVTQVRASAQGVTGAAALTVAQVMTAVELTPSAVSVAPGGQTVLTPRRRDANGYFIPGGTFTFASSNVGAATVSASGVVTGVALGTSNITATSGAVTSAPAVVTVTADVPAVITFGRDTLAIGRSATNVPIPVYLSRVHTGPVVVNLAVADTFAFFSSPQITIPAGQTVGTAQLNGRNAGTTAVFATDAGQVFAGDTATLAVQATVRFTNGSYNLMVNDQLSTQVLLTDPSPAGGTYITYAFGTPGRVNISPDPAFIPAGQLAANVVIAATAAGGTTVTPQATGVSGTTTTVSTTAATLTMAQGSLRLGAGQFRNDSYVYTPLNLSSPLPLSFSSSDTTRATVTPAATIPSGSYYAYFTVSGRTPGTATVTAASPGWNSPTLPVTVTTPKVGVCCGTTFNTTSPATSVTVYSQDSTSGAHWRSNALSVQLSSSDTSVLRVVTPTTTIAAGAYFSSAAQVRPGATPGTAWLRVSASGHIADSVQYTVVGPQLDVALSVNRVGVGQYRNDVYVYTPNNVTSPLVVYLSSSSPAVAGVPDSVVIPSGTYYTYFTIRGLSAGTSDITVTAAGYQPRTRVFTVTTPRAYVTGGTTLNQFAPPVTITTYSADSSNSAHWRTDTLFISYRSTDTTVITVTPADTIFPGEYFSSRARVVAVGPGTARVIATAAGHLSDSTTHTVIQPRVQFSFTTYRIGARQYRLPTEFYVSTPNARADTVPVTITQTSPSVDSLSRSQLPIPPGLNYAYFGFAGLRTGVDTLIATAPGYLPDTAFVIVTSPRLTGAGLPGSATTTSPPSTVTVFISDSLGSAHYSLDTLLVAASSSNGAVIQPDSVGFRIPRGAYFGQPRVRYLGPGSATVTYRDSLGTGYGPVTSNTVTVTGPSLGFVNNRPVLGMRQYGLGTSAYVTIPNAIASALTVNLVSTDTTVATVPPSVTIPAGQTFAYVDIRGQSVAGTVQIQATATGYAGANVTQQVTVPRFTMSTNTTLRTTSPPSAITIYAADANGTAHYVWEPVTVTLESSNPAAATVDSLTVTIPAGNYFNNGARVLPQSAGSTTITASDARSEGWRYNSASANVAVNTPDLQLGWSGATPVGIGQWIEPYVYVNDTRQANLVVSLASTLGAVSVPATVTIPTASNIAYHRITGVAEGADTVAYTAPGHNAVRGAIAVGRGRVDNIAAWPGTMSTDSVLVTLYARDQAGNVRNVAVATTFNLQVNGGAIELRSGVAGSQPLTSVTIPVDASSVNFYVRRLTTGTATVTITNANYQTHITPTVTVP